MLYRGQRYTHLRLRTELEIASRVRLPITGRQPVKGTHVVQHDAVTGESAPLPCAMRKRTQSGCGGERTNAGCAFVYVQLLQMRQQSGAQVKESSSSEYNGCR